MMCLPPTPSVPCGSCPCTSRRTRPTPTSRVTCSPRSSDRWARASIFARPCASTTVTTSLSATAPGSTLGSPPSTSPPSSSARTSSSVPTARSIPQSTRPSPGLVEPSGNHPRPSPSKITCGWAAPSSSARASPSVKTRSLEPVPSSPAPCPPTPSPWATPPASSGRWTQRSHADSSRWRRSHPIGERVSARRDTP